jgi:hypothetical protein
MLKEFIAGCALVVLSSCSDSSENIERYKEKKFQEAKKDCIAQLTDDEIRTQWAKANDDLEKWEANQIENEKQRQIAEAEKLKIQQEQCSDIVSKTRKGGCNTGGGLYYEHAGQLKVRVESFYERNLFSLCREKKDKKETDSLIESYQKKSN